MKHASLLLPDLQESEFVFASYRLKPDGTLLREDEQIHLPPKELAALRLMLEHAGRIVTPQQLKTALWGDVHVTSESVPRCVSSLRNALLPDEFIQTVYKKGYRLSVPVRTEAALEPDLPPRLAVLPFAGSIMVPEHLGAAVAEETLVHLCREYSGHTAPFTLIARDSIFTLARQGLNAVQIGRAVHADLVLTGTLRAQMTDYRLRAEIIRVRDEAQLWVEDFQIAQSHWAGLELALAERLAFRLGMVFQPAGLSLAASADPVGPAGRLEAWERFQRGHQDLYSSQRIQLQESLQNLLRATELDPSLLQAQIDLIQICLRQSTFGFLSPAIAAEQVRRASRAIPRSDPAAVSVLPAIGWLRFHVDRNLAGAVHAFEESAHLPHDAWTTRWRVSFALSRGQWQEAASTVEAALRQDPFAPWLHGTLAWCWHLARQPEKSLAQIERTLAQFDPDDGFGLFAVTILAYNGRAEEAIALAERLSRSLPDCDLCASVHAYALACAGRRRESAQMIERLQWLGRERYVPSAMISAAFMELGNAEAAIEQLRIAEQAHCPWFFQMLADPRLDQLHDHPEFLRMQTALTVMEASLTAESPLRREPVFARLHEVKR